MQKHDLSFPGLLSNLNPAALITIDGLAICCFNKGSGRWEVAFLHQDKHHLTLAIADGAPEELGPDVKGIEIYSDGESPYQLAPGGCYTDGKWPFDRSGETNDREDFRWVLDHQSIADMPLGKIKLRKPAKCPVTLGYMWDAYLWTKTKTPQALYRVPNDVDANEHPEAMIPLGKANDQICAVLFGQTVTVEIIHKNSAQNVTRTFDASAHPIEISLMNMRHLLMHDDGHQHSEGDSVPSDSLTPKWAEGDFKLYYLALKAEYEWSLWGKPAEDQKHGDRIDCDSIQLSGTDSLAPLVGSD